MTPTIRGRLTGNSRLNTFHRYKAARWRGITDSSSMKRTRTSSKGFGEPTPAEIRAACAKFRAGWSETERRRRAGLSPTPAPLMPPEVSLGTLDGRQRISAPDAALE